MSCNSENIGLVKINYLLALLRSKAYMVYKKPFELNIVGIRNKETNPILFDDSLYVFWKDNDNRWNGRKYKITTDPSTIYLEKNQNKGVAILPSGQYFNKFKIGSHKGQYEALVQAKNICVYRDFDRNNRLTFNTSAKDCGMFGINIHRAKTNGADDGKGNTTEIGLYSAGCQVFQNFYCFQEFMGLVKKQESIYRNRFFTYTLVDLWTVNKLNFKRNLFIITALSGLSVLGYGILLKLKGSKNG
tara:strand:- start:347 stop:1081 length:735 start_codon:yes stop_codon:yes gene_type:complete